MLYLKEANLDDAEAEWQFIAAVPEEENGFVNRLHGVTWEEFIGYALPDAINSSRGIGLPPGYVPSTSYFLWKDGQIVGLFRLRSRLNDALRQGAGHIGFCIGAEHRGRGLATTGLGLLIQRAWDVVQEEELYLAADKNNLPSLRAQLRNGAYIHHEDGTSYYLRIPRRKQ